MERTKLVRRSFRKQRSMAYWFALTIGVVVTAVAAGNFYFYYKDLRLQDERNIESALETVRRYGSEVFELPILLHDDESLRDKAKAFLSEPFILRVQIYDAKGRVLQTISKDGADNIPTTIERVKVMRRSIVDRSLPGNMKPAVVEEESLLGTIEFNVTRSVFSEHQQGAIIRLLVTASATIIVAVLAMLWPLFRVRRTVATIVNLLTNMQNKKYVSHIEEPCEISDFQEILDKAASLSESLEANEIKTIESIRQLQETNQELQRSEQRTRAAEESVRRFIRIGSHELRNPVNGLMGMLELLKSDLERTGIKDQKILDRCHTSLNLLDDMQVTLERLFDLSKMTSGAEQLKLETTRFSDLLQYVRLSHAEVATAKRIKFDVRVDGDVPPFFICDAFKVRHIISNLVVNAIKFTRAGYVEVVFSKKPNAADTNSMALCVSVIDTGTGIEKEDLPNIFSEFYTRTPGVAEQGHTYSGWGLGLSFVKRMVELMLGTVSVKSEPGRGTEFALEIPVQIDVNLSRCYGSLNSAEQQLEPLRILLVDDDEVNLQTLAERLESLGAVVEKTVSAHVAKAFVVQGNKYDIAIVDYRMPGYMNGAELALELRSLDTNMHIVGLTGDNSREVRDAWETVVDKIVYKPISTESLRSILDVYRASKSMVLKFHGVPTDNT